MLYFTQICLNMKYSVSFYNVKYQKRTSGQAGINAFLVKIRTLVAGSHVDAVKCLYCVTAHKCCINKKNI